MSSAAVVGSGPNGLAAAVTLARAGVHVTLFERSTELGGGAKSTELFERGVWHDSCSAVHPMGFASPFFRAFELDHRVDFVIPEVSFAQVASDRIHQVRRHLSDLSGKEWRTYVSRIRPLVDHARAMNSAVLGGPWPRGDARETQSLGELGKAIAGFKLNRGVWTSPSRAVMAGVAAHAAMPVDSLAGLATGTVLAVQAHAAGWPIPRGGSQSIIDALVSDLLAHGGRIEQGRDVRTLEDINEFGAKILTVTPSAFLSMAAGSLPHSFAAAMERFRYGPSVQKYDFLTSEPIPWNDPAAASSPTVHLGTGEEIARAEAEVASGRIPERPFVLLVQADLFDTSRTVAGRHAVWCYTHLPPRSTVDQTDRVIQVIEKFAPGFKDTIVEQLTTTAVDLENRNPNYVGGDILSGHNSIRQVLARPRLSASPWKTPVPNVYLASASTYPGPGVHGMAGYQSALLALHEAWGIDSPPSLSIN